MDKTIQLTTETHKRQIEAYAAVRQRYSVFADLLRRILGHACHDAFPEALVQARAKTISSFAEKVARKFARYPDAVNQMTDLCGARVIVQTTEQVCAVREFIEANFEILEKEDKGLLLRDDEFGYRDMHYIVRLRAERVSVIGISAAEWEDLGGLRAELQVRTWLQHAWADTLHDRMYKTRLRLSPAVLRTGALAAALMEEGDRGFSALANGLDGLIANYSATAPFEEVQREIAVRELILANEPEPGRKPALALQLASLLSTSGDHARVVELLSPFADNGTALRAELLLTLGDSLCRLRRSAPTETDYGEGVRCLSESTRLLADPDRPHVPNSCRRSSLRARGLVRLAWALEVLPGREHEARRAYHEAHDLEPANPYHLAEMLGYEFLCARHEELPAILRTTLRGAIRTCREHALAGMELPAAYFAAARLHLLLGEEVEALSCYSLGIRHCLEGVHCVAADALEMEAQWIRRTHMGVAAPAARRRAHDLLALAQQTSTARADGSNIQPPVLIIAGGAGSASPELVEQIRPLLVGALSPFRGTVISGGTRSGVPGCVGDVSGQLAQEGSKLFRLAGYLPRSLPLDVQTHPGYDELVTAGNSFSPEQIIRQWSDVIGNGINPRDVLLLGFGGGAISTLEYHLALGLGASVGVVQESGGAVEQMLSDPLWASRPNLSPLPFDSATLRAFVVPPTRTFEPEIHDRMARTFHDRYVASSSFRLPGNLRPWSDLDETYRAANLDQALYAVAILEAAGFTVQPAAAPRVLDDLTEEEIELMARLEHGRWNVERMRNGWRYGVPRDDSRKIHDCLVTWAQLPEKLKDYDREAVRTFPRVLVEAGLEVRRRATPAKVI